MFGPRFQAAVAMLSVRNRISRCDVVELCEQLFGSRISSGTVDAILCRVADALEDPCDDLLDRLRASKAVNMDETAGGPPGSAAPCGHLRPPSRLPARRADRHEDHAKSLLADTRAVVTSDRWWAYTTSRSHASTLLGTPRPRLQRARRRHRRGERARRTRPADLRARVLGLEVFQHTHDRPGLQATIRELQREFKPIVRRYAGKSPRYKYCRAIARNLLKAWPALDLRQTLRRRADQQPR